MQDTISYYFEDKNRKALEKYDKIKYRQLFYVFEDRVNVIEKQPIEAIETLTAHYYGNLPKMEVKDYYRYFNKFKPYLEKNDYIGYLAECLKNWKFCTKPSCKVLNASHIDRSKLEYLEENSLFTFSSSMGDFIIYYHIDCKMPSYVIPLEVLVEEDVQYLNSLWRFLKNLQINLIYNSLEMYDKVDNTEGNKALRFKLQGIKGKSFK